MALASVALVFVPQAKAAVYWGGGLSFGHANLDGSLPFWPLPSGSFPALSADGGCDIAVDADHLYWANTSGGSIGRAGLDGYSADQDFIGGLSVPCGVAVDGSHIYWTELEGSTIGRANLDGSNVERSFIVGAKRPCGVAVDATHIYWTNQGGKSIGRANLDGTGVDQDLVVGPLLPCGIAVDSRYVYWGDQEANTIGRADLAGGEVEPAFISGAGEPWSLAVDGSHIYWANRGTSGDNFDGGIGRARLDGGEPNRDLIPDAHSPTGVALDTRIFALTPPSPQPSEYLRFGRVVHDRTKGTLQLVVQVPGGGDFRVDSPNLGWSIDKRPQPWPVRPFKWTLKLWPGRSGPVAARIRTQLGHTGRAAISLRVTYQQEGKLAVSGFKRLVFQRRIDPDPR